MKLSNNKLVFYYIFSFIALVVGGFVGQSVHHPHPDFDKQETSYTVNANLWRFIDLGLHAASADVLWIQTLLESDIEHYKKKDLNSWLHLRFLAISILDPLFYENYLVGGQYLMIVKDDLEGASNLLELGLERYPSDMSLNWHLGYLWIFERNDLKSGYPYFEKVSQSNNRPAMFDSMFTKLKAQTFGLKDAYSFALESWKKHPEGSKIKQKLEETIYSLKAKIDLQCLNESQINCEKIDFEGKPYLYEQGAWKSSKPLVKTNLSIRTKKN